MSTQMFVRDATPEDVSWLLDTCHTFADTLSLKHYIADEQTLVDFFAILMKDHLLLICEIEGEKVGMFAAIIAPHYFNKNIIMATEVFWWVDQEHRRTGAGEALLDFYVERVKDRAHLIFMYDLPTSGVDDFFKSKGFKLMEKVFVREM